MTKYTPIVDRVEYGGASIGLQEVKAIIDVILSQDGKRWTIGSQAEAFEKELAGIVGVKHAIVTNSGSSALLVALQALHLPPKSLIVIPALNFPTAFNAIMQTGNIPYVVDIDPKTLLIDLEEVKKAIRFENIKAVIAVNVGSNPVDTVKLKNIVGPRAFVITDNCDGLSTTIDGKFVETYTDVTCTSFHAAHIVTMGEGGAVMTNNKEIADRSIKIREWGRASGTDKIYNYPGLPEDYRERYVYEEIGYNLKPLELQCALGRAQLTHLMEFKKKRLNNFNLLYTQLNKMPKLRMIEWLPNSEVCWFSFPFICEDVERKIVMDALEKNNIECRTIFSGNILRHPAYKNIAVFKHGEMPNADEVMFKGMFISVHPSITKKMINFIVEVLKPIC